jgi:hypothetical protein
MTRITRLRRITLHFSHIGLTLGRTFIALILWGSEPKSWEVSGFIAPGPEPISTRKPQEFTSHLLCA